MAREAPSILTLAAATPSAEETARRLHDALADLAIIIRWAEPGDGENDSAGHILVADDASYTSPGPLDLVVLIDDGPSHAGVVALHGAAPDEAGRAWRAILQWAGTRLDRAGLADAATLADEADRRAWANAYPDDPLAAQILRASDPAEQLAAAEAARAALDAQMVEASDALVEAQAELAARDQTIDALHQELGAMSAILKAAERSAGDAQSAAAAIDAARADALDKDRPLDHLPEDTIAAATNARRARWVAERTAQNAHVAAERARETTTAAGLAQLSWPETGDAYAGEVLDGAPHGLGVLAFGNGDRYAGGFENGVRAGAGIGETAADGRRWIGEWRKDQPSGAGVFMDADGRIFEGAASGQAGEPSQRKGPAAVWAASGHQNRAEAWPPSDTTGA